MLKQGLLFSVAKQPLMYAHSTPRVTSYPLGEAFCMLYKCIIGDDLRNKSDLFGFLGIDRIGGEGEFHGTGSANEPR